MDLTILVDVAIGLSLVYLGASLFVTIINEYVAQLLQLRGKQLAADLKKLIDDPQLIDKLKSSPALRPFFDQGGKLQSYVDPNVVARMLVGGLGAGQQGVATMQRIVATINGLPDSDLKRQLAALSQSVKDDVDAFVQNVAQWADRSLTMLGEVYKKKMQWISLAIGLAVAIAVNLDTIALTGHLYRDKDAREATSAVAVELVRNTSRETFEKCAGMEAKARSKDASCTGIASVVDGLQQRDKAFAKLPIGWPARPEDAPAALPCWLSRPLGWILTALAISLGASFWFDLLNRLVNMRHGMRRPEVPASK